MKNRTVDFTWNAVPGATSYVLEIGRTRGGTELAAITLESAVAGYRAIDMPTGISFARVRAKDPSATSAAGAELRFIVPDLRDIIEALFFETGPNAFGNHARSVMLGWPQGTNLATWVWGLSHVQYGDVERSLQQVEEATNGAVRGTIVGTLSDEVALNFMLVTGELHVIVHPAMPFFCSDFTGRVLGCADSTETNGVILAASAIAQPSAPNFVLMHEIGHAALGLRHIQLGPGGPAETWPGLPQPLMSGFGGVPTQSALTPMELEAVKMVYAAGLRGGAHRSAFYAAGLINNP